MSEERRAVRRGRAGTEVHASYKHLWSVQAGQCSAGCWVLVLAASNPACMAAGLGKAHLAARMQLPGLVPNVVRAVRYGGERSAQRGGEKRRPTSCVPFRHLACRQAQRLVRKENALSTALEEFGGAAEALGKHDDGAMAGALGALFTQSGRMAALSKARGESMAADFEAPIKEAVRTIKSVQAAMAGRAGALAQYSQVGRHAPK